MLHVFRRDDQIFACMHACVWAGKRGMDGRKIKRTQERGKDSHSHRLRRHDGEILRGREVREAESVPQHHVLVVEVRGRIRCYPSGKPLGGFA